MTNDELEAVRADACEIVFEIVDAARNDYHFTEDAIAVFADRFLALSATRAAAHAERLAKGLEALANGLETIMPFAKDGMDFSLAHTLVDQARQALSAYRSEKDEAQIKGQET